MTTYIYRGDRLTDPVLKGATVHAMRNSAGKCIRGRNSNMLVMTDDGRVIVVLARQLRKAQP